MDEQHLSMEQIKTRWDWIQSSPSDNGVLQNVVVRPATDEREELETCALSSERGLHGDNWTIADDPQALEQIAIINTRVIEVLAQERSRWQLAGDQLYIDLDLSENNLPAGQKLQIGTAILEITSEPHTGCKKFAARFGVDALKFVNSAESMKTEHLRGVYARVIQDGSVRVGDVVRKIG